MKKIILLSMVLCFTFVCCACHSNGKTQINNNDWAYMLPNEYQIWHINSQSIVLGKKQTDNSMSTTINRYIISFCYGERFVGLKCIDVPSDLSEEIDKTNPNYYIVDTEYDDIYGPMTEEEFEQKTLELNIVDFSSWIETVPRPKDAVFSE